MCSSPKSSGKAKPLTTTRKGFAATVSVDALNRFASCANAADERRQQRLEQRKIIQ